MGEHKQSMVRADDEAIPAFVLSSVIAGYPGKEFGKQIGLLLSDSAIDAQSARLLGPSWETLKSQLARMSEDEAAVEDLRSEYIEVFERPTSSASPYETEYGRDRSLVKGRELVDVAGFYRAFGMEFREDQDWREMLDHVSVELEFYALLLMKQVYLEEAADAEGTDIVLGARKKFLQEHLGRFVHALAERPSVLGSPFFSGAFSLVKRLVEEECARLGVEPVRASWSQSVAGEQESDLSCGSGVNPKGGSLCSG